MEAPGTESPSDRQLAAAVAQDGDEAAFRALYRRHTPRLYLLLLRVLGGDENEAEDAVQETWMRACRALGRFRWDCSFATWLIGIGLNVARNRLRQLSAVSHEPFDEHAESVPAPVPPSLCDGRLDLERAIATLPDGCRTVLVLHDVEGMKHQEIARRLGIAEGTSKSQLFAARRLLRARLGPAEVTGHA